MNVPLLTLTEVVEQPAVAPEADIGHQPANATLYIDADNQSCQCAKSLANVLKNELGLQVTRIVIAGNNHGKEIENWRAALADELPDVEPLIFHVSSRKQAADAALIVELGANLERHRHSQERIIIVSRDDFLVGAAEHAKTKGCLVLVAYAHSEIPAARSTRLTTLVLPAVSKPSCPLPPADQSVTAPSAPTPTVDVVRTVIAELRKLCTKQLGGGYTANEVGQALSKLGFDTKAKRTQFLKAIPGLHEHRAPGRTRFWCSEPFGRVTPATAEVAASSAIAAGSSSPRSRCDPVVYALRVFSPWLIDETGRYWKRRKPVSLTSWRAFQRMG